MMGIDNLLLEFASFGAAALGAYVVLELGARLAFFSGRRQAVWLLPSATAMGTSLWSMHFLGMRAAVVPFAIRYDVGATIFSWLSAIAISGLTLFIVSRRRLNASSMLAGSVVMGFGVCLLHFMGMSAMRIEPGILYDAPKVAASLLIASVASAAALFICFSASRRRSAGLRAKNQLASATLIGGAICLMHFVATSAAHFAPHAMSAPGNPLESDWIGFTIALLASVAITILLLSALKDSRIRDERDRQEADRRKAELEREYRLMNFDSVTKLANAKRFQERLARHMVQMNGSTPEPFGLVYAELRSHRAILEHLGQVRYDAVLRLLAAQFRKVIREGDVLARISDEGFLFLMLDRPDRNLRVAMNAICGPLSSPVNHGDDQFRFIWNLGSSHYPQAGASPQSLIRAALRPLRQIGIGFEATPRSPRMGENFGMGAAA